MQLGAVLSTLNLYGKVAKVEAEVAMLTTAIGGMSKSISALTQAQSQVIPLLEQIIQEQTRQSGILAEILSMVTPAPPVAFRIDLTTLTPKQGA